MAVDGYSGRKNFLERPGAFYVAHAPVHGPAPMHIWQHWLYSMCYLKKKKEEEGGGREVELEDECCDNGIQEELERGRGERYNHNTLYN